MSFSLPQLVPLGSAVTYTFAALMLKRGTEGAGPWRVNFLTNMVQGALYSALWFLPSDHPATALNVGHAILSGVIFFIGQIFTFLALSRGDVSVATPVLGSKVIFVAIFSALFGTEPVGPVMWFAVLLTAAATALLGIGHTRARRETVIRGIIYGLCAAAVYALTDITQRNWVLLWGFPHYAATLFLTVAVCSFSLMPVLRADRREVQPGSVAWTCGGAAALAVQSCGIAWAIITIGATVTNVLYASRGLWSVILVWTIGHWFGNSEREHGRAVLLRRLAGSMLLVAAIFLTARGR